MVTHSAPDRDTVAPVIAALAGWYADGGYSTGVHPGDLGWHLRVPDLTDQVHAWWDDGELVAVALVEGVVARPQVRPDRTRDHALAGAVADRLEQMPGEEVWSDSAPGALHQELVRRGWTLDPDPWVSLFADGRSWRVPRAAEPAEPVEPDGTRRAADDVAARVAVQRAGFEGSTFDEASWHRMAAGPGYRPDLDLLVLDPEDGRPAACATAWLSVPGGPAILEPVATDRDRQGRGLGRRVTVAAIAAALDAGASGVSVSTPATNEAAVATYRSAGMVVIETLQGLMLERRG